jgi:hypothetical protein
MELYQSRIKSALTPMIEDVKLAYVSTMIGGLNDYLIILSLKSWQSFNQVNQGLDNLMHRTLVLDNNIEQ